MGVRWQDAMRPPVGLSVVVQPTKPTEPPCKGSTFKGPFHVPRSLIMADVLLGDILEG